VHSAAATVLRAEFVRNLTGLYDGAARDAGVWLSLISVSTQRTEVYAGLSGGRNGE
jgi:hypothetical protein